MLWGDCHTLNCIQVMQGVFKPQATTYILLVVAWKHTHSVGLIITKADNTIRTGLASLQLAETPLGIVANQNTVRCFKRSHFQ